VAQIRVAAHVHSDWSYDGSWNLADLARAFHRRGYSAVLMAEHDRGFDSGRWAAYRAACAEASARGGAILVPGIEYSDSANDVHIPVWGDIPFLG
jgi:predicted metal-dependent phosphoesterase TrpH